jgi:protein-disulfide isomerase
MIDQPKGEKPALTVVIQSWWTPALAVLMLVVGLLIGYFGHPLLNKSLANDGKVAAVATQTVVVPTAQSANPTTTADPTQQAIAAQQMMDSLVSKTTNFQGDPNAKVTIIEFSDYQ